MDVFSCYQQAKDKRVPGENNFLITNKIKRNKNFLCENINKRKLLIFQCIEQV